MDNHSSTKIRNGIGPGGTLKYLQSLLIISRSGRFTELSRYEVSVLRLTPIADATSIMWRGLPSSFSLSFQISNSVNLIDIFSIFLSLCTKYLTFRTEYDNIVDAKRLSVTTKLSTIFRQINRLGNALNCLAARVNRGGLHFLKRRPWQVLRTLNQRLTKQKAKISEMANTNNNLTSSDSQTFQPKQLYFSPFNAEIVQGAILARHNADPRHWYTVVQWTPEAVTFVAEFGNVTVHSDQDAIMALRLARAKANPRPKRKSRTSGKPKASVNYAAQVVGRFIPLTQNGQTRMLEVA